MNVISKRGKLVLGLKYFGVSIDVGHVLVLECALKWVTLFEL
jgi:hypothetical protein